MLLEGKIAVVTGASNGIGKAITDVFVNNGAKVIGIDIIDAESENQQISFYKADISNYADCERVYSEI